MRFALQLLGPADPKGWLDRVRWAEDTGFSTVSMQDHVSSLLAPMPALAVAAAATSSVRLATFVLANDLRHPAIVAKDAATIHALSGGRFELGLGAGWLPADYEQLGLPFEPPGRRIARLAEAIDIVTRLFAGESVSFTGDHYALTDLELLPRVSADPPRLIVAGGGPRILALAGRTADVASIVTNQRHRSGPGQGLLGAASSYSAVREGIEAVRSGARGRSTDVELNLRVIVVDVTADPAGRAEEIGRTMGMSGEEVLTSPFALVGTVSGIVERVHQLREELGVTYFTVDGAHGEALAPVVGELAA